MFKKVCDICERSMDYSNTDYKVKIIRKFYLNPEPFPKTEKMDVCSTCMAEIVRYIRNKKEEKDERA